MAVTKKDVAPEPTEAPAVPDRPSFGESEGERLDRVQREALAAAEAKVDK